jgi:hypothetical protein
MKSLMIVLGLLLCVIAGQPQTGQRVVRVEWIKWDPGSSDTDTTTKIVFNDQKVYADSSGTWKRIDNTADSCSYPFWLGSGDGAVHPIWYQALFPLIDADDDVAQNHGFRIEVRNRLSIENTAGRLYRVWGRWIATDMNSSSTDITVDDSVATIAPGTGSKVRQELRFATSGEQGRVCPSDFSGYAAGDTTENDSMYYIGR